MRNKVIVSLICLILIGFVSGVVWYKDSQLLTKRNGGKDLLEILDSMACSSKEYCWFALSNPDTFTEDCEKELSGLFNANNFEQLRENLMTIEANSYMTYQGPPVSIIEDDSTMLIVDGSKFLRKAKVLFEDHTLGLIQYGSVKGNQIDEIHILRTTTDIEFSWMDVTGLNNEYFMIPDNPLIEEMYGDIYAE